MLSLTLSVASKIILECRNAQYLDLLKKVSVATSFSNHDCTEKYNYNHVFLVNAISSLDGITKIHVFIATGIGKYSGIEGIFG